MVEPTKVCAACEKRKPWSQFHAKVKWPDGTMRQPQSRCKVCHGAANRANPEPRRKYDRRRYRRIRKDPTAWERRLEQQRFEYRKRRGVTHVSRPQGHESLLPSAPLAAWLREIMARDEASIRATAERLSIGDKTMRDILKGRRDVDLNTVEQTLIADDTITLRDLYPELYT